MTYLVAFLFPFSAGWSMVAANALWDAPDRPPVLWGAGGRMLMIAIYILTGLLLVTGIAWMFHKLPTAHSIMVIIAGALAGTAASNACRSMPRARSTGWRSVPLGLLAWRYVIAWVNLGAPGTSEREPPATSATQWTFPAVSVKGPGDGSLTATSCAVSGRLRQTPFTSI